MNNEYQDRIDRYLLGKMSETESLDFENSLTTDKDLKEQYEFTKNVKEAIAGRSRRLARIKEWKEAYEANVSSEEEGRSMGRGADNSRNSNTGIKSIPRDSSTRYLYWLSGIAAILVVGFFIVSPLFFDKEGSPDNLICVNASSLRGGDDNTDVAKLINEGNYDMALSKIEAKLKGLETEKLQTEQEKAKMDKEEYSYINEVYEIQMDELNLLKAYALLGLKRTEEAMIILDGIRQYDSKFKAQADSLYNLFK